MTRFPVWLFIASVAALAQQPGPVPALVKFSGVLTDVQGNAISGRATVTFCLYQDSEGGTPLWSETQQIEASKSGHYSVMLGAATNGGLPADVFATGQARWVGAQAQGQPEKPRSLLLSVPYALKAADAETVGGLPASAFIHASAGPGERADSVTPVNGSSAAQPALAGSGTLDFIPLWTPDGNTLGNSILFQSSASNVGVGTQTPAAKLDVNGASTIRGNLSLPATGAATATAGSNSNPLSLIASSFSSSNNAAVSQTFRWRAEPAGNNTVSPSATLNLLYGAGTTAPAETGLKIGNTGLVTFATGQTFPGAGTITGIKASNGLAGGGASGYVALGLVTNCASGQVLQWNGTTWACSSISTGGTITGVTAGTDLTGGGTSGKVTLNVDTTKVPQLNASNTFTATQTFNGVLALPLTTGSMNGVVTVAGLPFLHTIGGYTNTFVGASAGGLLSTTGGANTGIGYGGLNKNTSGVSNTALGFDALFNNTTGGINTAIGHYPLYNNTSGSENTAIGDFALYLNTSGGFNVAVGESALTNTNGSGNVGIGFYAGSYDKSGLYNISLGYLAGPDQNSPALTNATAIGANATVSESNAVVLGGTGSSAVRVGIGTPSPQHTLDVRGDASFTGAVAFSGAVGFSGSQTMQVSGAGLGPTITLENTYPGGGAGQASSLDFDTYTPVTGPLYNPSSRIEAVDQGNFSDDVVFYANTPGMVNHGLTEVFRVFSTGGVRSTAAVNAGMYAAGATFTGSSAIGSADGFAGSGGVFTGGPPDYYNINTIGGDGGEFFGGDNGGFGGYFVGGQVAGGVAGDGIYATSQDTAGYFSGNVTVIGTLTAAAKYFKIDHPLDPANKYLIHASVESPEMKNIYDGLVVLDGSGEATVVLPEWFETLNTDFRYQLTSIGAPAPNLYIAQEVRGNSFQIAGGSPGMKVSWQITGVRQDAYAKAHPLVVSVDKNERERGFYMQPDLYGLPEEKQIEWGRYPAMMKRAKELRSSRRGRTERR